MRRYRLHGWHKEANIYHGDSCLVCIIAGFAHRTAGLPEVNTYYRLDSIFYDIKLSIQPHWLRLKRGFQTHRSRERAIFSKYALTRVNIIFPFGHASIAEASISSRMGLVFFPRSEIYDFFPRGFKSSINIILF